MSRSWEQNPCSNVPVLSRNENQMLALNYENLCDADYLNRLFTVQSGILVGESLQAQDQDYGNWLLTADIAENIIVFGDDLELGKYLLQKRLINKILSAATTHDVLSIMIQRQVIVFENISRLVQSKCLQHEKQLKLTSQNTYVIPVKIEGSIHNYPKQKKIKDFTSDALGCALRALAVHSRNQLQRSAVDPILSLLLSLHQEQLSASGANESSADRSPLGMNGNHLQDLREILCNGVEHGMELFAACFLNSEVKQTEEHLKLTLSCAYGLLTIGAYMKCQDDILMAFFHLIAITMLLEKCQMVRHPNDRDLELLLSSGIKTEIETDEITLAKNSVKLTINENIDQQKNQLKLKIKMKNKEYNNLNTSPILKQIPPTTKISTTLIPIMDTKQLSQQNDFRLQQQQQQQLQLQPQIKVKNTIKSTKWDINSTKVPLNQIQNEKLKDSTHTKMRIILKKTPGDISEALDCITNKLQPLLNINKRVILDNQNGSTNKIYINNNEEHSPQSSESPALTINKQGKEEEKGKNGEIKIVNTKKINSGSHCQEMTILPPLLRSSLKNLILLPKSVLRIMHDTCSDLHIILKQNKIKGKIESIHYQSVIASNSTVWSCGQNSYGELGHYDGLSRKTFHQINFLDGKGVVSIGAGNEHSIFVCKDGQVYVTGYNDNGQCGNGNIEQVKVPQNIVALEDEIITHVFVFNGCEHTLLITKDGRLYSFGYNYRGQVIRIILFYLY